MLAESSSAAAKRACDSCHRRKVKCVGEASQPCRNCLAAGLGCTYNAIPQKKGPKGSRAKIISELRESQQRQPQQIQLESTVAPRVSAIASARHERENVRSRSKDSAGRANVSTQSVLRSTPGSGRATVSASASPVQNLGHALNVGPSTAASGGVKGRPFRFYQLPSVASFDYVRSCVDFFFLEVYPNQPILGREETNELCAKMEESAEKHCLVIALCAYVTLLPNMAISTEGPLEAGRKVYRATVLLDELLQVRKGYAYMQSSSTWTVITSYFLFACYSRMENNSLAWFYLREATTIALMLGMHDEQAYQTADIQSNIRRRRLYWLLFVSERVFALQKHRPLTLHATIQPPRVDDDPAEAAQIVAFTHLVNLYRPFDDTFVALWNKASVGVTITWLEQLQQQLSDALPVYLGVSDIQAVDLRVSQQWLRTMVWQLSMSYGFLSSKASVASMTLTYPIELSRDVLVISRQYSQETMEVHGIGFIEKLYDIACTLTNLMSYVSMDQDTFERGPREHLQGFVELLSRLRGGSSHYLPMLLIKLDNIGRTGAAQQTPVTPISATTMSHTSAAAVVGIDGNPFGGLATDLHGVPMQSVSAAFLEPGGSQFQSFGSAAGMADPCHGGIEASYSRAPDYSLPAASIPLIASQSSFIPISNIAGTTPLPTPLLPSQPIQPIRRTAGPIRRGSSGMGVTSAVAPPASKGSSRQRTARHTPGQTPLHTPQLSTAAIASPSNSPVAHYQSTPPPLLNVRQQNIAMCSSPMQLPVPVTFAEALMGSPYLAGNPSLAHAQLQADAQAHAETHISPLAQVEDHLNTHLLPTAEHFQALQEHYNLHSPYGPL